MDIIALFWQMGRAMQETEPLNQDQYKFYSPYFQSHPDSYTLLIPKDGHLITEQVEDGDKEIQLGFVEYIRSRSIFPSLTVRPKHLDLLFSEFIPFYLKAYPDKQFQKVFNILHGNYLAGTLTIDEISYSDFCQHHLDKHSLFVLTDENHHPLMKRPELLKLWFRKMKDIHDNGKCFLCGKEHDLVTPKSRLTKGWTLFSSTRKSQVHPKHQPVRCVDCEYAIDRTIELVERVSFHYRTSQKNIQYAYLPVIFSKDEINWLLHTWSKIEARNRLTAMTEHLDQISTNAEKPVMLLELKFSKNQAQFEMLDAQLLRLNQHQLLKAKRTKEKLNKLFKSLAIDNEKFIPTSLGEVYRHSDDSERFLFLFNQLFYSFMGYSTPKSIQWLNELEKMVKRASEMPISLLYFKLFLQLLEDERGEGMGKYTDSKEYAIGVIFRTAMELQAESPMYFQNNYQDLLQTAIARKVLYGTRIDLNRVLRESMKVIQYKSRYIGSPKKYRAKTLEVATSKLDQDWLPDPNERIEAFYLGYMANVAYPDVISRPEKSEKENEEIENVEEEEVV